MFGILLSEDLELLEVTEGDLKSLLILEEIVDCLNDKIEKKPIQTTSLKG